MDLPEPTWKELPLLKEKRGMSITPRNPTLTGTESYSYNWRIAFSYGIMLFPIAIEGEIYSLALDTPA